MSGATVLDIYNLALSYLDSSQRVLSLTDNSAQAGYCNAFYARSRQLVLEQCYWSFATRAVQLTLLADQENLPAGQPLYYPGWRFIYARPTDCLKAQAVTTQYGLRANPFFSYWWYPIGAQSWGPYRPPWIEALDYVNIPTGQSIDILTDQDDAWLVETIDPPDVTILPETFISCVAWQLAAQIAGPASANQKAKEIAIKMAPLALSRALAQNLNEMQEDPYPDSPSIQARL